MKNGQIFRLANGIAKVGHLKGIKFAYGVVKNKKIVDTEIENLRELVKTNPAFDEFTKVRMELIKELAEKDDKGEIKTVTNEKGQTEAVIPDEKKEEFEIRLQALREQHKEAIDEQEKKEADFEAFQKEESKVEFYKIKLKDVPEDISAEEMQAIDELIEE